MKLHWEEAGKFPWFSFIAAIVALCITLGVIGAVHWADRYAADHPAITRATN